MIFPFSVFNTQIYLCQKKFQNVKKIIKSLPAFKKLYRNFNNQYERDDFVLGELKKFKSNSLILDAGCGSQRYREHCAHLNYKAQDFGQYTTDLKKIISSHVGLYFYWTLG